MNRRKPNKKNLIWFSVLVVLIVAGILARGLFSGNQQGYRTITVFETEGNVSVVNNGIEYKAYPGMVLQEGYAVVTSANSYVRMILDGDKYVKLEQGSRATFETLGLLGSGKTRIHLERGTIISEIVNPLDADDEFVVNTTNAVLAVRGTFFRVDVQGLSNGEVRTDVYTYGGRVASQRILPDGLIVEEEVLIDAGYRAAISMTEEETVYLTENVTERANQERSITPIVVGSISDNDMVDMFFASDNGHELFITTSEIKAIIEDRELPLEEYSAPYDKAEEVVSESITATTPDDNRPLVPEETEQEEEVEQIAGVPSDGGKEPEGDTLIEEPVDVAVEETPEEIPEEIVEEPIPEAEPETGQETTPETGAGEESSPDDSGGDGSDTTVTPPASGGTTCSHANVTYVGTASVHGTCDACGATISTHEYVDVPTDATCTVDGETEYTCNCGHVYKEVIAATGHTELTEYTDGTATADGKEKVYCSVCNATIKEETLFSIPKNFPDAVFAAYVTANFDTDGHNSLNATELAALQAATTVNLAGTSAADGGVASLTGIANFTSLTTLNCAYNAGITSVPCSALENLENLNCANCNVSYLTLNSNANLKNVNVAGARLTELDLSAYTGLTSLNVDGCSALTILRVNDATGLTTLDIDTCTQLKSLSFKNTGIASLDVSNNTVLAGVWGGGSALTAWSSPNNSSIQTLDLNGCTSLATLDITDCTSLTTLDVSGTLLTGLNLNSNTGIDYVTAQNCPSLVNVTCTNIAALSSLDVKGCTALKTLNVSGCTGVTGLTITNCTALEEIDISYCSSMVMLTTSSNPALEKLNFSYCNNISRIDVTQNANLTHLWMDAGAGYMSDIDLTGNPELLVFSAYGAGFTSYDFSQNTKLEELYLSYNQGLTDLDITYNTRLNTLDISNCISLGWIWTGRYTSMAELEAVMTVNATGCNTISVRN